MGLPAGLALLIASPRAVARARLLNEQAHYNSYLRILDAYSANQAPYTPNVLGIYLLMRSLADRPSLIQIAKRSQKRAKQWYDFLTKTGYELLVREPTLRSQTVIALKGKAEEMYALSAALREKGLPLSPGYGKWRQHTLRLANFPAIQPKEIHTLQQFLANNRIATH